MLVEPRLKQNTMELVRIGAKEVLVNRESQLQHLEYISCVVPTFAVSNQNT